MLKPDKKTVLAVVIILAFASFLLTTYADNNDNLEDNNSSEAVFEPENSTIDEFVNGKTISDCTAETVMQKDCATQEALYVGCNGFL